MLVFVEGGKPEDPVKNPWSMDENQQQTQPTYDARTGHRTQARLVEGECSHHCAMPGPQMRQLFYKFKLFSSIGSKQKDTTFPLNNHVTCVLSSCGMMLDDIEWCWMTLNEI